jgi:predicted O-methyltransferase YrrM|tara:strand:- start:390 stop:1139 length:750 start_codon:yes stop_codon:yes gene_type:complete
MTTKSLTGLLAKPAEADGAARCTTGERLFQIAFGAIQWPWLLKSLYGGTQAEKQALLERVGLAPDALPHLGSWKADTYLLRRVVDMIEKKRPTNVVELGSGATSLVIAKALAMHGGGALHSYDQHLPFVAEMQTWLAEHKLAAHFGHAPLTQRDPNWPGVWYSLPQLPQTIDLLLIDGPPWAVHPFVRGMADRLFDRIAPDGIVMLDDAARPGERYVAKRWRRDWPDFTFTFEGGGTKGLLIGRKIANV